MRLAVITPEDSPPHEAAVLEALFAAGLERCQVRKPGWPATRMEAWVRGLAPRWWPRLVLHAHHPLVGSLGLGGRHWRDDAAAPVAPPPTPGLASRSCHDRESLAASLGRYDAVLFGPVFPSFSKPGYGAGSGPEGRVPPGVAELLQHRGAPARPTAVLALGGIAAGRLARCAELGFDGVAVLGAIWQAADPVAAWRQLHREAGTVAWPVTTWRGAPAPVSTL